MARASKTNDMGKKSRAKPARDYQQLKSELESVLADLQREDLDVDQALERYERGLELVRQLERYLATAENTVRELKAKFNKNDG